MIVLPRILLKAEKMYSSILISFKDPIQSKMVQTVEKAEQFQLYFFKYCNLLVGYKNNFIVSGPRIDFSSDQKSARINDFALAIVNGTLH